METGGKMFSFEKNVTTAGQGLVFQSSCNLALFSLALWESLKLGSTDSHTPCSCVFEFSVSSLFSGFSSWFAFRSLSLTCLLLPVSLHSHLFVISVNLSVYLYLGNSLVSLPDMCPDHPLQRFPACLFHVSTLFLFPDFCFLDLPVLFLMTCYQTYPFGFWFLDCVHYHCLFGLPSHVPICWYMTTAWSISCI